MDPTIKCILVDNISPEWKRFATEAAFDKAVIDYINLDNHSDQLKMDELLKKLVLRNPSDFMSIVEKSLVQMGKADIWNEMQMFYASYQLKAFYLNTFRATLRNGQNQRIDLNYLISKLKLASMEKEDLEMDKDDFNEWEFFRHKQNSYKPIKYEEVFDESSQLILISGPKGIGKTNFLQSCLYHWANRLHWENLNFIFYFEFSKINKLQHVSNIKQLIEMFYKNILKGYEISSFERTMFIIDGLDEFLYLEQLVNHEFSNNVPILTALRDIFSLKNCKCVLSGNVKAVLRYYNTVKDKENVANMQILGFNTSGTISFLEDILFNKTLKTDLENLSASSRNVAALLSVPLYLKAVCSTLLNLSIQSIKTVTELQTLIFLYLMQQNCESNVPLWRFMQINHQHILKVCEVAFCLLDRGKVNISQNELGSVLDENGLEPFGFLKKSVVTQQYQFVHFFLIKLCASIHLLFNVSIHETVTNGRLHNCLPFISGFVHVNERSILSLICQLKEPLHKQFDWLRCDSERKDCKLLINCLIEAQVSVAGDLKKAIDNRQKWNIENEDPNDSAEVPKQRHVRDEDVKAENEKNRVDTNSEKKSFFINLENMNFPWVAVIVTLISITALFILTKNFNDAKNLYDQKHFDDAEKMFRYVGNVQTFLFGVKHVDTLNTKYWIAKCTCKKQHFDNAIIMFRNIENMQREVLGEKHAGTLNTKIWIARCIYDKKEFDNSEKMFREVENMQKEELGEKHPYTLNTKYWIAKCIYKKQQFENIENKIQHFKNSEKRIQHFDNAENKKQQFENAENMFRDVENIQKEVLGEKHTDTLNTKYWIAMCLYEKHQFDNAENTFRDVESMQKEVLGVRHADTFHTKFWIAMCKFKKNQFVEAENLFKDVEKLREEVFGKKHENMLNTKYWITISMSKRGQWSNFESMLRDVENMQKEVLEEKHGDH